MKIYISGAMTGIKDFNYPKFDLTENMLLNKGYTVVNPANIGRGIAFKDNLTDAEKYNIYLKEDLKALLDCDSIYMLEGWKDSTGANIEHDLAIKLGFKIIYET